MKTSAKTAIWCGAMLCCLPVLAQASPQTYTEFERLPKDQKRELTKAALKDPTDTSNMRVLNWWWRSQVSEEEWQYKERERLIDFNQNNLLSNFFITYQGLRETCLKQEWYKRVEGLSADQKAKLGPQFGEIARADAKIYNDVQPLLASIAPSAAATALNEKAHQYTDDFYKKHPTYEISRQEMQAVDQLAQQLLEQIKQLPKLTPEQVQAEIEALPYEDSLPRGLSLPVPQD